MLAMWGLLVVIIFMVLIMTKKATPFTALVLSPIIIGLMAGFANELGGFALDGVKGVAPTVVMLLFAILFFGLLTGQTVQRAVFGHADPFRQQFPQIGGDVRPGRLPNGYNRNCEHYYHLYKIFSCLYNTKISLCLQLGTMFDIPPVHCALCTAFLRETVQFP